MYSGLGAGLIARALDQHRVNLTICEIDPVVHDYARKYFGVPEPAEAVLEDAKNWLGRQEKVSLATFSV
jgi:spermidine synthase